MIISLLVVVTIMVIIGFLLTHKKSTIPAVSMTRSGCVSEQFIVGSSGTCVSDIQNLVNFIETDGLTECTFVGGQRLSINGTYDTTTQAQITVVQKWENCYNHQEGSPITITTSGNINTATWSELCTYGYEYPSKSGSDISPYRQAGLAAGKAAGCAQLFTN
jgi:hypothetical protein